MINIADGTNGDLSATVNHDMAAGSVLTIEVEAANGAGSGDAIGAYADSSGHGIRGRVVRRLAMDYT